MLGRTLYRQARLEDLDALATMYARHWGGRIADHSDKMLVGRYNVLLELVRSPLSVVAEVDGAVAGVCLGCRIEGGRVPEASQWVPLFQQVRALASERISTADEVLRDSLLCDEWELRQADSLIAEGNPYTQAQLTLFMVNPQLKGHRLGTALLERMGSLMREAGATRFFLMSDTSSDFGFYEHRGMTLLRTIPIDPANPDAWAALVYGSSLSGS